MRRVCIFFLLIVSVFSGILASASEDTRLFDTTVQRIEEIMAEQGVSVETMIVALARLHATMEDTRKKAVLAQLIGHFSDPRAREEWALDRDYNTRIPIDETSKDDESASRSASDASISSVSVSGNRPTPPDCDAKEHAQYQWSSWSCIPDERECTLSDEKNWMQTWADDGWSACEYVPTKMPGCKSDDIIIADIVWASCDIEDLHERDSSLEHICPADYRVPTALEWERSLEIDREPFEYEYDILDSISHEEEWRIFQRLFIRLDLQYAGGDYRGVVAPDYPPKDKTPSRSEKNIPDSLRYDDRFAYYYASDGYVRFTRYYDLDNASRIRTGYTDENTALSVRCIRDVSE